LRAESLFKKDKDYVVQNNEVIIVDEFTGRMMEGRRYSQGLHQAIEAKENVQIQRESKTLATITFQNYFRLYEKLSGMTGTAFTEAEEFTQIYGLNTTVVPTNKPILRDDKVDRIYRNEKAKYRAVVKEIKRLHEEKKAVLVGTASIEKNELLVGLLKDAQIPHEVLNAKNHESEATIIAQAGKPGSVTIATNMAGRGVDIVLGGNPSEDSEKQLIKDRGGLHVIGTERHESRRIDNQLRGRAGRQGDPGMSQFYVSMEDELMRIFASDRMKSMMEKLNLPEDVPIENKFVSRSLTEAQKRVETHNYDMRKHVVQYDDVLNKQRTVIYAKRGELLIDAEVHPEITKTRVLEMIQQEIDDLVSAHTQGQVQEQWDIKEIYETMVTMFPLLDDEKLALDKIQELPENKDPENQRETMLVEVPLKLADYLFGLAAITYDQVEKELEETVGDVGAFRTVEKQLLLRTIDNLWIIHLETMDALRGSIGLRGYGQRDPLVEYKKEGFNVFNGLLKEIQKNVVYSIFKVRAQLKEQKSILERAANAVLSAPAKTQAKGISAGDAVLEKGHATGEHQEKKVGRNEPCPCGSGKKYKKCHGA
jgi:preprotein translocase subunit SecA